MLSQEIQSFINDIRTMAKAHPEHGVSCLTVPRQGLKHLLELLKNADWILNPEPAKGKVTFHHIAPDDLNFLLRINPPSVIVITEEDYAENKAFATAIQDKAAYFMNVK